MLLLSLQGPGIGKEFSELRGYAFFLAALEDRLGDWGSGVYTDQKLVAIETSSQAAACLLTIPPPLKKKYWPQEGLAWRIMGMIQLLFSVPRFSWSQQPGAAEALP